jgi:hypothetical protein
MLLNSVCLFSHYFLAHNLISEPETAVSSIKRSILASLVMCTPVLFIPGSALMTPCRSDHNVLMQCKLKRNRPEYDQQR